MTKQKNNKKKFDFIDLFAGLGGFHLAMESLGGKCVFASELKEDLRNLYKINFPQTKIIVGDITKDENINKVPPHDVLCAGFPCQPFSQAGKRKGFSDEGRGNLFYSICAIVKRHRPRYIFLENVANLKGHDNGNTWNTIKNELENLNYKVAEPQILSPHQFGIPQHRKRIYIVCENKEYGELEGFEFPKPNKKRCDIRDIIRSDDIDYIPLKDETRLQLETWQEFINQCAAHKENIPSFPIWAMEFGATYEYKDRAPAFQAPEKLLNCRGQFGKLITNKNLDRNLSILPKYARTATTERFPRWKIRYIEQNREFYKRNKKWLDEWLKKIDSYENSHMKMEWNCGQKARKTLYDKVIQFRASGIRVKLPTFSPALNLCGTQIPIIPWIELPNSEEKGRYLTRREAAILQGMEKLKFGNKEFKLSTTRSFEALGNAVNVDVVKKIASKMLEEKK